MKIVEAEDIKRVMGFPALIEVLDNAFGSPFGMPQRQVYHLPPIGSSQAEDCFAVLPAWNDDVMGVKAFTHLPGNPAKGLDTISARIMLFSRNTGAPIAILNGTEITFWRTAAVSALASSYLSKKDASRLLLCGTGLLAPFMALAHASIRPIERIDVWGRNSEKAAETAALIRRSRPDINVVVSHNIEADAREADIISCATGSNSPIVLGEWIEPGTHIDLVGNHSSDRRECDTSLIEKSLVTVDSRLNVLNEAGELLIPIAEGRFDETRVHGELAELCRGEVGGRQDDRQITLFKSVGTALSDLAAAHYVVRALDESGGMVFAT